MTSRILYILIAFFTFSTTARSMKINPIDTVKTMKNMVQQGVQKVPNILDVHFTRLYPLQTRVKCYVLSDLHCDSEKNQIWVKENCIRLNSDIDVFTVLLLPGDIGSEIDRLVPVWNFLVANYDAVVFVIGNHEAWKSKIRYYL